MSNEASAALCSSLKTSNLTPAPALLLAVSQLYLEGTEPAGQGRWLLYLPLGLILKLELKISVNIWCFVLQLPRFAVVPLPLTKATQTPARDCPEPSAPSPKLLLVSQGTAQLWAQALLPGVSLLSGDTAEPQRLFLGYSHIPTEIVPLSHTAAPTEVEEIPSCSITASKVTPTQPHLLLDPPGFISKSESS